MGSKASIADGEYAALVPLSSSCGVYLFDITTSTDRIAIVPGEYKIHLKSADASCVVYMKLGTVAVTAAVPSESAAIASGTFAMRGDEVERLTVGDATSEAYLAAILSSGATANSLVLTKLA